jgi:S-adenosylmethionine:tRNA ribosyltransferase-isomerase
MIKIQDYQYILPENRIAKFPLPKRDESKLLIYQNREIEHQTFKNIPNNIPYGAMMVFNNTKVIPARIHFVKETGATIEIFLLQPADTSMLLLDAMQSRKRCSWICTIGNLKRWPKGTVLQKVMGDTILSATLVDEIDMEVELTWSSNHSFAEIIEQVGEVPLPPYLKREAEQSDTLRYQTIYSKHQGAVAAPTAGLHFTDETMQLLAIRNIKTEYLTLHVSAGTFQPVKTLDALEHIMHSEQIVVSKKFIENLLNHDTYIIPIGTTSMRTLESMYWMGVNLINKTINPFIVYQRTPYQLYKTLPSAKKAFEAILKTLKVNSDEALIGTTFIYIHEGYDFKVCDALVTNFHQPGSTLMLLVAAFVGSDWKTIYQQALDKNYRFLSYGDSSLLWRNKVVEIK